MSSYFSMKTNKRKVTKSLNCVKEFLRRFDLANGKYLSIFLGAFARIVKVSHFAQVINFRERAHGKIHSRKVDKNNRIYVSFFFFCFSTTAKQRLLSLLQRSIKNKLSLSWSCLCFSLCRTFRYNRTRG